MNDVLKMKKKTKFDQNNTIPSTVTISSSFILLLMTLSDASRRALSSAVRTWSISIAVEKSFSALLQYNNISIQYITTVSTLNVVTYISAQINLRKSSQLMAQFVLSFKLESVSKYIFIVLIKITSSLVWPKCSV